MKNLEKMLSKNRGPEPTRELPTNFTESILSELRAHPQPLSAWHRLKETIIMKLHKPASIIAAVAVVTLLGGTAFATQGFTEIPSFVNAIFSSETKLADGSRVVAINTKDCSSVAANGTVENPTDSTAYFQITPSSTLTNAELLELVQGNCENNNLAYSNIYGELAALDPANANTLYTLPAMKITAIDSGSLVVSGSTYIQRSGEDMSYRKYTQTFSNISPQVIVDKHNKRANWSSLSVGDTVVITVRTTNPDRVNTPEDQPWQYDAQQLVVHVRQDDGHTEKAVEYTLQYGKLFEQVKPCGTQDAPKYCPVVSVNNDQQQNIIQKAYTEYVSGYKNDLLSSAASRNRFVAHTDYSLTSAIFEATTFDRITCSQNVPTKVTFGQSSTDNGKTTTQVTVGLADDSSQSLSVTTNNKTNKITAITCPSQ